MQSNLLKDLSIDLLKVILSTAIMGGALMLLKEGVPYLPLTDKGESAVLVFAAIPVAMAFYFAVLWATKFRETDELRELVVRFFNKEKQNRYDNPA